MGLAGSKDNGGKRGKPGNAGAARLDDVPAEEIEKQVDERLKQLARNVKMHGFRPGKVPMKIVAQTYGPQVRHEVLGDAVQKSFSDAVKEANLKVAGYPRIEKKDGADADALEFSATFEVYPEVKLGRPRRGDVERPQVAVDDAEVDETIEILRKQRTRFVAADRAGAGRRPADGRLQRHDRRPAVRGRQRRRTSSSRSAKAACCRSSRPRRAA